MNELSSFFEAQEDCIVGSWQKYLQWLVHELDIDSMSILEQVVSDPKTFQTIQGGDGNNRLRKCFVDRFKEAVPKFQANPIARSLTHFGSINDQYSGANSNDPLASLINHSSTSHSTKRSPTVMERPATAKERHDTGAKSIARRRPNDDDDQQQAGYLKPTPAPAFTQPRPTLAKKSATGVADLQSQNQSQHVPNALEEDEDHPVHNALFPSSPVLRLNLINIATDLNAISLHLRHSTEEINPLVLSKELSSLYSRLLEEAVFVEEYRSSDPKISEYELEQETLESTSQSMDRLLPMLIGASENDQEQPSDIAPPILYSSHSHQQQIPSAVIADVDDDSDSDAVNSQSQEENISSLTNTMTASDVLDILDLRAIAKSKHLDLVKRIEEAYFEATMKAEVQFHLMFGQYDIWSLMNIAKSDLSQNKSSIRAHERQFKALLLLMEDRSNANGYAKVCRLTALEVWKKAELKSIDDGHFSMNLSEPASSLLTALQEEEGEEGEQNDAHDNCPYHVAAESAAKEAGIDADWIDVVKFAQQMKNSVHRDTLGIIMCRVMQMVPFHSVAKGMKNKNTIAFLDKNLSDWRDSNSKRSIADVWDSLIVPYLQGTPDFDMVEAYRLTVLIAQRLSCKDFEKYFLKAESIPLIELFEECDAVQCLQRFISGKKKSYFLAEDSNGKGKGGSNAKKKAHVKSAVGRKRRLTAARSFLLPATFTAAMGGDANYVAKYPLKMAIFLEIDRLIKY